MIVEIPSHIHQKMIESIRRGGYQETEHNRLLSIGRIYHTLSLVTEDNQSQDTVVIFVQQHKPMLVRNKTKTLVISSISFFKGMFYKQNLCIINIVFNALTHRIMILQVMNYNLKV